MTIETIGLIFLGIYIAGMIFFVYNIRRQDNDHEEKMKKLRIKGTKHKYIISYQYSKGGEDKLKGFGHVARVEIGKDLDITSFYNSMVKETGRYPIITNIYKVY